ncbi:uncharacterized protein LOC106774844 [Vigna radiata var. radiata]|uniref:Uncharacterized protein LOC106774844 n=1 Tax=Vigna radiata var. radiata TaxID=3916 RepID=A0A1S3VG80_VIGRR|nr:uncharacterized protein LOC106774844 [Vigna radiata var. radiata]
MESQTEGRLNNLEMTVEGIKAIRRDLQQLMRGMNGGNHNGRNHNQGGGFEESSNSKVAEEDKVELAYISMEGSASYWFKYWREKTKNRSWMGLKAGLVNRFGGGFRGTVYEQLATLRQEGSVEEYVRDFERLLGQTQGLTEELILGFFLAGLREEIKGQVRIQDPQEFMIAVRVARDVEDAMNRARGGVWNGGRVNSTNVRATSAIVREDGDRNSINRPSGTEGGGATRREGSTMTGNTNARGVATAGGDGGGRMVRNLPYPEYLRRRAEGRCFQCGGPFAPGHRCPEKSSRVLLLAKDEIGESEEEVGEETKPMELSAYSAEGLTPPKTMKLIGLIGEKRVVVLIDSGASHNFISRRVVEELKLSVVDTPLYTVSLDDGHKKVTRGKCESVRLRLGDTTVEEELYVFELGGVDVVLGIAWLAKLGEVTINWGEMAMKFCVRGEKIIIRGDPALSRQLVEPRELWRIADDDSWAFVWELGGVEQKTEGEVASDLTETQQVELRSVLHAHGRVFQEREGLPPQRAMDHRIMLKEGTNPINVRPYRYPYLMKEEIEKQAADMLKAGIIRPSQSPYSSPVILVKKKDGSWRFCVDYWALNKATFLDKFPIPIIEELLDELKGARYFSKLDPKAGYNQIRMGATDISKTAFRTHQGHFEFLVMPFGLTNAPATFQHVMNELMAAFLRKWVLVFFDDILVYSPTWEEHMKHLKMVLQLLEQQGWVANPKKCEFGKKRVHYFGHQISEQGVEMDYDRIKAVVEWGEPKNLKALRGFLGLTGYYRRFVWRYGELARPLTELLKKGRFEWTEKAGEAMAALKSTITSAPVLALPDFTQEFHLECDASGRGVGAVLM